MITRRTIIKAIGGAIVCPRFTTQDADAYAIMAGFCSNRHTPRRYDLARPWVVAGYAYGTDGAAMARIAVAEADTDRATRRLPLNIDAIWRQRWTERGPWRPWPTEQRPTPAEQLRHEAGEEIRFQYLGLKIIDVRYVRQIQTIPGALFNLGDPDPSRPILIKSPLGVEAMVMPRYWGA